VIQMTRRGAVSNDADLAALRHAFAQQQCARLNGFLEPALVDEIRIQIERGEFREFAHGSLATELRLETGICTGLLHFLTNEPQLFRLVESVSGCTGIRSFAGRVYRRFPGGRHYDNWHGDVADARRLIGMSVNLSTDVYEGGVFEIREVETERLLASLPNTGFGDAILFRLSDSLEHRVSDVRGAFPKTAFAGWFFADLDFDNVLRHIDRE
jgi:2OG-Fe(II) oxygenase superfamily